MLPAAATLEPFTLRLVANLGNAQLRPHAIAFVLVATPRTVCAAGPKHHTYVEVLTGVATILRSAVHRW